MAGAVVAALAVWSATAGAERPHSLGFVDLLFALQAKAQGIYFALQRAASTPRERAIVVSWIQALQVAQVASGRLIQQTSVVDANARFWRQRLARGGHFWFALLRRGPAAFAERVVFLLNSTVGGARTLGSWGQQEACHRC